MMKILSAGNRQSICYYPDASLPDNTLSACGIEDAVSTESTEDMSKVLNVPSLPMLVRTAHQ